MSKVRINDLARELEVKSKAILDTLPVVGVTEKKTHSSSREEHEAEKVRVYLRSSAEGSSPAGKSSSRGVRGEEEIKTKIDLSHISRPGDVLKAIAQRKEAVVAPRPVALPVEHAPSAHPPGEKPVVPRVGVSRPVVASPAAPAAAPPVAPVLPVRPVVAPPVVERPAVAAPPGSSSPASPVTSSPVIAPPARSVMPPAGAQVPSAAAPPVASASAPSAAPIAARPAAPQPPAPRLIVPQTGPRPGDKAPPRAAPARR